MTENVRNETQFEIISLLFRFIVRRINAQHILFILAFLTFGVGDAVTAAVMMDARGISAESNVIVAYIYANHGLGGLIAAKIWLTIILLAVALIIYWRSQGKSYWMVNGFLMSLTLGGIMATMANLQATAGLPYMNPTKIMFIYCGMVILFVEAGDFVDTRIAGTSRTHNGIYTH